MPKRGQGSVIEKILNDAFAAAGSHGEYNLASVLINVSTVYISGYKELMGALALISHDVAKRATERLGEGAEAPPLKRDPLDEHLHAAAEVARHAKLNDVAAALLAMSSLYASGNRELMRKLAEAAASLSSEGVGRRSRKAVLLVDNDLGEYGEDSRSARDDGFMEIDL